MKNAIYWTENSFGSGPIPVNFEEICSAANAMIDAYESENPCISDEELAIYSEQLWNSFCMTDTLGSVEAEWEEV